MKFDDYLEEAAMAENEIKRIYKGYHQNPDRHPAYRKEWQDFWNTRFANSNVRRTAEICTEWENYFTTCLDNFEAFEILDAKEKILDKFEKTCRSFQSPPRDEIQSQTFSRDFSVDRENDHYSGQRSTSRGPAPRSPIQELSPDFGESRIIALCHQLLNCNAILGLFEPNLFRRQVSLILEEAQEFYRDNGYEYLLTNEQRDYLQMLSSELKKNIRMRYFLYEDVGEVKAILKNINITIFRWDAQKSRTNRRFNKNNSWSRRGENFDFREAINSRKRSRLQNEAVFDSENDSEEEDNHFQHSLADKIKRKRQDSLNDSLNFPSTSRNFSSSPDDSGAGAGAGPSFSEAKNLAGNITISVTNYENLMSRTNSYENFDSTSVPEGVTREVFEHVTYENQEIAKSTSENLISLPVSIKDRLSPRIEIPGFSEEVIGFTAKIQKSVQENIEEIEKSRKVSESLQETLENVASTSTSAKSTQIQESTLTSGQHLNSDEAGKSLIEVSESKNMIKVALDELLKEKLLETDAEEGEKELILKTEKSNKDSFVIKTENETCKNKCDSNNNVSSTGFPTELSASSIEMPVKVADIKKEDPDAYQEFLAPVKLENDSVFTNELLKLKIKTEINGDTEDNFPNLQSVEVNPNEMLENEFSVLSEVFESESSNEDENTESSINNEIVDEFNSIIDENSEEKKEFLQDNEFNRLIEDLENLSETEEGILFGSQESAILVPEGHQTKREKFKIHKV